MIETLTGEARDKLQRWAEAVPSGTVALALRCIDQRDAEIARLKAKHEECNSCETIDALQAEVARLKAALPKCSNCSKPAACLGSYEDNRSWAYACDTCCGHGNEDGRCFPLADIPGHYQQLVVDSDAADERAEAAEQKLAEAERSRDGQMTAAARVAPLEIGPLLGQLITAPHAMRIDIAERLREELVAEAQQRIQWRKSADMAWTQLTEAQGRIEGLEAQLATAKADGWEQRAEAAEQKLAEAEKRSEYWLTQASKLEGARDAAAARVRELEAALARPGNR